MVQFLERNKKVLSIKSFFEWFACDANSFTESRKCVLHMVGKRSGIVSVGSVIAYAYVCVTRTGSCSQVHINSIFELFDDHKSILRHVWANERNGNIYAACRSTLELRISIELHFENVYHFKKKKKAFLQIMNKNNELLIFRLLKCGIKFLFVYRLSFINFISIVLLQDKYLLEIISTSISTVLCTEWY